ncbi:DUF6446 family protein [Roseovarius ramblicola]|uniref:DUF6446 family protein n=1 Tax=Roseovarius ramblicola TaxID=2022336 RepID=A0ABV5I100_9RHOB
MGKVLSIGILVAALIAGVAMYYLQVYHFYEEVRPVSEGGHVEMRITLDGGDVVALPVRDFDGIDADSSPIRFRACFETDLPQDAAPYAAAEPLNAPGWFDCFDAGAIGAALGDGTARAYLSEAHITYGIDRVIAVYPDGRAFAWHQINRCGEVVFDGQPAPDDCPEPPQGY